MNKITIISSVGLLMIIVVAIDVASRLSTFDWILGGVGILLVSAGLVLHNNPQLVGELKNDGQANPQAPQAPK